VAKSVSMSRGGTIRAYSRRARRRGVGIVVSNLTVGFFGSLLDRFQERPVELDSLVAEYEVFQLRHATTEGQMVEHCSSGKAFLIML